MRIDTADATPRQNPNAVFDFAARTISRSIRNPYLLARYAVSKSNPPPRNFDSAMSSRAAPDEKAFNISDGSGRIGTSSDRKTMLSRQPSPRPNTTSAAPDSISATASPIALTGYGRSGSTMITTL